MPAMRFLFLRILPLLIVFLYGNFAFGEIAGERGVMVKGVKQLPSVYGRRVAICVGINEYDSYPRLKYAVSDAKEMSKVFDFYGFDKVTLLIDKEATRQAIIEGVLMSAQYELKENDLLVFYFAGHGDTLISGKGVQEGYIIPFGCTKGDEKNSAISTEIFRSFAENMRCNHVLFIIDSCYSGTSLFAINQESAGKKLENNFHKYVSSDILKNRCVYMLTAGGAGELAVEIDGNGLFTKSILDVLYGKTEHLAKGGVSVVEDLGPHVRKEVREKTGQSQKPMYGYLDKGNGDIVFSSSSSEEKPSVESEAVKPDFNRMQKNVEELEKTGNIHEAYRVCMNMYRLFSIREPSDKKQQAEYLEKLLALTKRINKTGDFAPDMEAYLADKLLQVSDADISRANCYNILSRMYLAKGYYAHALDTAQMALDIYSRQSPELQANSMELSEVLLCIGCVRRETYDYEKALSYMDRALEIRKRLTGGKYSKDIAEANNAIGEVYFDKGENEKAIEFFIKALDEWKECRCNEDVITATANLGDVYGRLGKYDDAIRYYNDAMRSVERYYGEEHLKAARIYANVGYLYVKTGKRAEGMALIQKATDMQRWKQDLEHPDLAACYDCLGNACLITNELSKAEYFFGKALAIRRKRFGEKHPDTIDSHLDLAELYKRRGKILIAQKETELALEGRREVFGNKDFRVKEIEGDIVRLQADMQADKNRTDMQGSAKDKSRKK